MVNRIIVLIMASGIVLSSCKFFLGEEDKLTFHCQSYNGDSMQLNGYYYEGNLDEGETTTVYFLYKNGLIVNFGSFDAAELDYYESIYNSEKFLKNRKKKKFFWGIYKIKGDSICFEMLYPSSGPLRAYIRSGIILNDTTFTIANLRRSKDSEIRNINEVYHFKKFLPKPDSTNDFVCNQDVKWK